MTRFSALIAILMSGCVAEDVAPIAPEPIPGPAGPQGPSGPPISFSGRVTKTAPMTGAVFADATINGVNVCDNGSHPCSAWEAMVIEVVAPDVIFDERGWVAGSFPNYDGYLRSLVDHTNPACAADFYLIKYNSDYVHREIAATGGLHCASKNEIFPTWCCRDEQRGAP